MRRSTTAFAGATTTVLLVAAALAASVAPAASSGTVVTANIPSATSFNVAACHTGDPDITAFGVVQPGTSAITGTDCQVGFGSSNDWAMLRVAQADGGGVAMSTMSNGTRDTFGTAGRATTPAADDQTVEEVAVDSQNRTYVVGADSDSWSVTRYLANGSVDTSFDGDGVQEIDIGPNGDWGFSIAIQPDDKPVIAGAAGMLSDLDFGIARLTTTGALDPTFGTGGKVTVDVGGGSDDEPYGVLLQRDGRIVVIGTTVGTPDRMAVVRLSPEGIRDSSFGTNGIATVSFGANDATAYDGAIQIDDGKLVVAGTVRNATADVAIARLNPNGSLDTATFGSGTGKLTVPVGASDDVAYAVRVRQSDGKVVAVGNCAGGTNETCLVRANANGTPDTTFGTGGSLVQSMIAGTEDTWDAELLGDGRIVIGGDSATSGFIGRLNADGSYDTTWDSDGMLAVTDMNTVEGVDIARDGAVVVAGDINAATKDFAAVRYGGSTQVSDYVGGAWAAGGASLFGICLRSLGANTQVDGTSWARDTVDADCADGDADPWNAVSGSPSKIAETTGTTVVNASVNLRFGFKAPTAQAPGSYLAPLVFDVVAPTT